MINRFTCLCLAAGLLILIVSSSCSSAPKKPNAVYTERNMASSQLDLANAAANHGRYEDALMILEDARRLAVSVDDPPLLIRTSIAYGNLLFALGRQNEAFGHWEAAVAEAESSGDRELAALARIYTARGRIMLIGNSGTVNNAEEIRDEVNGLISVFRSDMQAQAAGYLVLGMAEKELERYAEAERAVRRALDFYEKNLYLEDAAYGWFFLASVFSVNSRYDDALSALHTAIDFDRRAENGFGLASSWQAIGEVYRKKSAIAPNTGVVSGAGADRNNAVRAFLRAAEIYRAIGLDEAAQNAEAKAAAIN